MKHVPDQVSFIDVREALGETPDLRTIVRAYLRAMEREWHEAKDANETDADLDPSWVAFRDAALAALAATPEPAPRQPTTGGIDGEPDYDHPDNFPSKTLRQIADKAEATNPEWARGVRFALGWATPEPAPAGSALLGLARTYSGGKVTLDADAFDNALELAPEPAPAVLDVERYRAIIEDTARWLETETPESFDGQRIALTLRHWLDEPADFDKYAGIAGTLRALTATPSEAKP